MTISLSQLKQGTKKRKRVGRGNASGRGTYSTRGMKGQRSRSGGKKGLKIKGFKRNLLNVPKYKGTKSIKPNNQIVKLSVLDGVYSGEEKVTPGTLLQKNLINDINVPVKILYDTEVKNKLHIYGCLASEKAKQAIEKAGGQFVVEEKETEKPAKKEKK